MATQSLTAQEFYDFYTNQVKALAPDLTDFSDGSLHDIIAGAFSACMNELTELTVEEFQKTLFGSATASDLDTLAVDHFGNSFARPDAVKATGEITFSRADTGNGDITIPIGTVVKTEKDSNGEEIRFLTTEEVLLDGLTVDAEIEAVIAGDSGNLVIGKIIVLETTLADSTIVVSNAADMVGGQDQLDDADYRVYITNLIESLAGATSEAIEGAVKALPSVTFAKLIIEDKPVIEWNVALQQTVGGFFRIPYPIVYVADENGNSNQALLDEVLSAVNAIKSCGVDINILGAVPLSIDWTAAIVLNAGGPNYSEFQNDLTKITDTMKEYLNEVLQIGEGMSKISANQYVLSIWGPSGTNDITSFLTTTPAGDVAIQTNEKIVAGTMSLS